MPPIRSDRAADGLRHASRLTFLALADITAVLYDYFASTMQQDRSPRFALIDILKVLQDFLNEVVEDPDVLRDFLAARTAAADPEIDDHK